MNRKITFLLTLLFLGYLTHTKAQVSCPSNIDFELGNFTGWTLYTGSFTGPGTPTWTVCAGPVAGRHTITSGTGTDMFGLFPVVAPGGGSYSAKLGNDVTGNLAERATYTFTVPTTSGIWSLIYRYAVVLEDPGHPAAYQPKMVVTAFDNTTSTTVPCATYTYVSSTSVPGFSLSSVSFGGTYDVHYKPWTYGNMKFPGLGGHSVTVDFSAYDCGYGGHFGYGYIDMTCGFFANSVIGCASGTTILSGPDGFSSYAWYDSATFTTSYGSSEVISITSPTVTTTYAVILTPFTGYGCPDTLYTRVIPSTLYIHPSHDTTICSGSSVTLSAGATSASLPITYSWTPSSSLSCSTCASPVATPTVTTAYIVTATDASSCTKTGTINVTVVPTPCAIGGPSTVCPLATVVETDCATGGTWSCTPTTTGTIVPLSGSLTGISTGTCTVVYTTGGICSISKVVTVTAAPAPIVPANPHVCVGASTTLTDATTGGVWSITPSGTYATIGTGSGLVTGVFAGTGSTVTYTAPTGCIAVAGLTVDPTPGGITGVTTICVGSTSALFDITTGGTWSISPTTVATVSPTGVVYGVAVGSATVTYTSGAGCRTTAPISIVPLPGAITGPTNVCIGATGVVYSDTTAGIIWSVSNPSIAFVDPFGALTTYATGVDTIIGTSSVSGCAATLVVTIDPLPVVTGVPQVCVGQTTLLSSTGTGLTWSSSDTTKATVSSSGLVTGISSGTVNITVTTAYGCTTVTPVLVNGLPLPITGPSSLCVGTTVVIADGTPGGTFSASPVVSASVTPTGTVSGLSVGTQVITYTAPTTGCYRTRVETVNTTPAGITGVLQVCQGQTSCLSDIVPGGSWSVNPTTIGTIVPTTGCYTGINPGIDTVKYSLGAGCTATTLITVNALPGPILPSSPQVCVGGTLALTDPPGPGTWAASCTALTIGGTTGIVTGMSGGTCTVTYTQSSTGCTTTKVVTVNSNPLPINPPSPTVCVGATTPLSDGTGGGTWTVTPITTATITPTTGVVYGVAAGVALVKYTLPTGCLASTNVTVNPLPPLFTVGGSGSFCAGAAGLPITLSGSTVGVSYQLFLGASPVGAPLAGTGGPLNFGPQSVGGTYTVVGTYSPGTGCFRTMTGSATLTVNPLPNPISGSGGVCVASTIILTDVTPGGTWHSSNPLAATCTAGPSTSTTVTGITSGLSTVISYTLPTSCYITTTVVVTPSPGPILGASSVCVGACTTLSDTVALGLWSSGSTSVATVGTSSGLLCGVSTGSVVITYSLGSGCQRKDTITVTAAPLPITGTHNMCVGDCDTFHDATLGGSWLMDPGSTGLGSIGASTGVFCGTATGVATISYAAAGGTGCGVPYSVTINPIPTPIVGPGQVCVGSCATYTSTPTGGTWSVAPTTYASVGATTGNLCGVAAGTSTILKYSAVGCATTMPVTINPLPGLITGTTHVCEAQNITLTSSPGTGTWASSNPALASVIAGPGATTVVSGAPASTGIATISYTLPTGCQRTTPITVNLTPAAIVGNPTVCLGHTTTLTDPTPGGTWSSSNALVASVGATTGVVSGVTAGCVTISYTLGSCSQTFSLCVVAPPSPIAGPLTLCVGDAFTYTDVTPGGTWVSSLPSLATIDPSSGLMTGVSSGTVIISYGSYGPSGCSAIKAVVINPIGPILGNPIVCQYQTTHLIDTSLGGTWSSSAPTTASVNPTTGVVTGLLPGNATITYYLPATGCHASIVVTVNAAPAPITGGNQVCVGSFLPLASTSTGGTWSSTAPLVGTVDPLSGVVNGLTVGYTTISYTLTGTTGCSISQPVTVNANPAPITGPNSVCISHTMTLTDLTPGGTWSSSLPSVASVDPVGNVYGAAIGTSTIMYSLGTGCSATKNVTVTNPPPPPTGPTLSVCQGQTIPLSDLAGPGSWSSSSSYIASVDPVTGVVTGNNPGTASIIFSVGGGCSNYVVVTVNALPPGITPYPANVCVGSTVTLTDTYPGGTWSSSIPAYADITSTTSTTAVVTGYAPGVTIVTYQLATGCSTSIPVNVSGSVPPITGIASVCLGSTTTLSDVAPGGTWSSSNPLVAPVNPATGVVSGLALGTAIIYYNTGGSCVPSVVVTVNPLPGPITGSTNVCQGGTTTLSDAVSGGSWSAIPAGYATVSSAGVVTGTVTGFTTPQAVTIVYMLGAGCDTTTTVMVNPVPANITGPSSVCVGQAITLSDVTPLGTWSSGDTLIGTVDIYGDVSGVHPGGVTISYTNSYSCAATFNVSVNAMPTAITGNFNVCLGGTTTLHDSLAGGRWFSSSTSIATIDSITGVVHGLVLGSTTIIYIYHGSCFVTQPITVVPLPNIYTVTGGGSHCAGDLGVHIGLTGSSVGVNYMVYRGATAVGAFAGTGSAMDFGLYTVTGVYTVIGTSTATGCSNTMAGSVAVATIPSVTPSVNFTISPSDTVCAGATITITPTVVNGGASPAFVWSINSHPVALTTSYSYIPADGDTVSVAMTSSATCANPPVVKKSEIVKVNPFAVPSVDLSISPDDTVCKGSLVTVTALPTYGGTAPYYMWFKNGAPMGTGSTLTYAPADGDVVYATMNSNYPCRLANADTSNPLKIKVDTAKYPMITINANPGTTISVGQADTLTATVANAVNPTYQWYVNGTPVAGATTSKFVSSSFSYPKEDSISVAVTNHDVCTITSHEWVYIQLTRVGVQQINTGITDINVIPNPNKGEFVVKGSLGTVSDEEVAIEITDVIGQVIYRTDLLAKNGKIDQSIKLSGTIANGMYILSVHSASGSKVFHVVIEK